MMQPLTAHLKHSDVMMALNNGRFEYINQRGSSALKITGKEELGTNAKILSSYDRGVYCLITGRLLQCL